MLPDELEDVVPLVPLGRISEARPSRTGPLRQRRPPGRSVPGLICHSLQVSECEERRNAECASRVRYVLRSNEKTVRLCAVIATFATCLAVVAWLNLRW